MTIYEALTAILQRHYPDLTTEQISQIIGGVNTIVILRMLGMIQPKLSPAEHQTAATSMQNGEFETVIKLIQEKVADPAELKKLIQDTAEPVITSYIKEVITTPAK